MNQKHKRMQEYYMQGHTAKEVADKFNVCEGWAKRICRGLKAVDREQLAIEQIEKNVPQCEYVDGFTHSDGRVNVRCKICGDISSRSLVTLRHGKYKCHVCEENERAVRNAVRAKEREKEKHVKAEARRLKADRMRADKERRDSARWHACPVCGKQTNRRKYCSDTCAKRVANSSHEARRRARIKEQIVDADITLDRLYERDKGVCKICGKPCDYGDCWHTNRQFVAGLAYPSIDHIIPLAKGGAHSWSNVQLAHMRCNSRKGAKTSPSVG